MSEPAFLGKIVARRDAAARMAALPGPVVFTNGVFDVLHRGHVTYLAQARALGGSLVVALNTDASARRLGKGPDRPLNGELDRAIVIAARRYHARVDPAGRCPSGANCNDASSGSCNHRQSAGGYRGAVAFPARFAWAGRGAERCAKACCRDRFAAGSDSTSPGRGA